MAHLLLSAARDAASRTSSSDGEDASVQRMTCEPGQPEAWYHQWEGERCCGERERTSLSVACFPTCRDDDGDDKLLCAKLRI